MLIINQQPQYKYSLKSKSMQKEKEKNKSAFKISNHVTLLQHCHSEEIHSSALNKTEV